VNFEACVLPLELRRFGKIINTGNRMRDSPTMRYLESQDVRDRLIEKRRSSFLEKLKQTQHSLKIDNNLERRLSKSELNCILKREWTRRMNEEWRDERQACFQNIKSTSLIYKPISRKRKMNSAWHQARLGVIPTKAFLFSIGKKLDNKCPRCKVTDNLNHMLSTCSRYRTVWMKRKMNRKPAVVGLGTFLGLDRPPPFKQRISRIISECSRWSR
jgi:phage FluMu protein Com